MHLTIIVPGEPVAQPRAKATTIGGKHARMYTPTTSGIAAYKAAIRLKAAEAYQGPLLDCPLIVDCEFVFARPKRMIWKTKPMSRLPHTSLRDRDNLDKAVLDALKNVIWTDDKLVYDGRITKWYAAGDEQPHTTIRIEWT